MPEVGQVIDDQGDHKHDQCPQRYRGEDVEKTELVHMFTTDHGDQSCCSSGRCVVFGRCMTAIAVATESAPDK